MKRVLRNIIAGILGTFLIMFGFVRRAKKQIFREGFITGLYFHNPSAKLFEKSITWLRKNGFNIIEQSLLLKILQKAETAPPGAVWLTFDDGWKDNMTNVVPFAVENNIPVTFFISTEPVESSGFFWWTFAEKYQKQLAEPYKTDLTLLWKIPESERSEIIAGLIKKAPRIRTREAMTVDDVKKISRNSFLTVGSHTINHVITPNCSDNILGEELSGSKEKLERWTGKTIDSFSFPNGDFSEREKVFLEQLGYKMAAIGGDMFIKTGVNIYEVPRFSVGDGFFAEELCHMFGVWQKAMKKIKSII